MTTYVAIGLFLYILAGFTFMMAFIEWGDDWHKPYFYTKRQRKSVYEDIQTYPNTARYVAEYNRLVKEEKRSLIEVIGFWMFVALWPLIWAPALVLFIGYWIYRAAKSIFESFTAKPVETVDPNTDKHRSFKE